ncbi:MAG: hypothetical protein JKX85_13570 [Phycisphaeraceae bacterium]|nr:hypothetical protein [Phycisphaeraceae bacterium]
MQQIWNVVDTKTRLHEILNRVDTDAPQVIRRQCKDYILMSGEQYRHLTGEVPNFLDYLMNHGPKTNDLEPMPRNVSTSRQLNVMIINPWDEG